MCTRLDSVNSCTVEMHEENIFRVQALTNLEEKLSAHVQVYRHCQGGYWKASKRWCKKLPQDAVNKALIRFASNEAGLCPACVYGGPDGAIEQLKRLEKWFQVIHLSLAS